MSEPLGPKDLEFLEKRRWLAARWNLVGLAMLAALFAFLAWLFRYQPRLASPFHVFNELQAGAISETTLHMMALMLPIMVSGIFMVVAVMIAFGYAVFQNERRYLRIIDQLRAEKDVGGEEPEDRQEPI